MTVENTLRRAMAPAMAAVAALTLAGCAATHIGEDWQCPLAQGARCVSVAAADPAVREADPALRGADPLAKSMAERRAETRGSTGAQGTTTETGTAGASRDCPAFCRPFRWFARLLEADADHDRSDASASANGVLESAANDSASETRAHNGESSGDADEPSSHAYVRLPETVGRIWIAPYVDADGVYREASWVRVVIAPPAWRAP